MSIFHIRVSPQLSGNGDKYQGASRLAFFFSIICLKGANMYLFYIFREEELSGHRPGEPSFSKNTYLSEILAATARLL